MSFLYTELTYVARNHANGLTINNVEELCETRYSRKQHYAEGWKKMYLFPSIIVREMEYKQTNLLYTLKNYKDVVSKVKDYEEDPDNREYMMQLDETVERFEQMCEELKGEFTDVIDISYRFYEKSKTIYGAILEPGWTYIVKPICNLDIIQFNDYVGNMMYCLSKFLNSFHEMLYEMHSLIDAYSEIFYVNDNDTETDSDDIDDTDEIVKVSPELTIRDIVSDEVYECAVCFNEQLSMVDVGTLQCNHSFCLECLHSVFEKDNTTNLHYRCPLCRTNITHITCCEEKKTVINEFCK